MNPLSRRKALGTVAAAAAALPALGLPVRVESKEQRGGELKRLLDQYRTQVDALNDWEGSHSDEEYDHLAKIGYQATERAMIGVPANSAADALAALDYLIAESLIEEGGDWYGAVVESLVNAVRDYLARTAGLPV